MTKKTLDKIEKANINVFKNIQSLKCWYRSNNIGRDCVLAEIRGFLSGLVMTGFITEQERRIVFVYITL